VVFVHKNYVTPLSPLENQFSPRLGLIPLLDGLVQANRKWKFDFWSNFPRNRVNYW